MRQHFEYIVTAWINGDEMDPVSQRYNNMADAERAIHIVMDAQPYANPRVMFTRRLVTDQ